MSNPSVRLADMLKTRFGQQIENCTIEKREVTVLVTAENLLQVCLALRDEADFKFEQLIDLCGVDYLQFGLAEWSEDTSSGSGFSRAVAPVTAGYLNFGDETEVAKSENPRFAVIIHLLSYAHNHRLRIRCYAEDSDMPIVPSLSQVWSSADWNEREAFDLYGILFDGHEDLRRILTDYGFVGHPFRKDFPLIGNVEMRYDPKQQRVIYQPVTIEPRVLVPRVIRRSGSSDSESIEALKDA